MAHMVRSCTQTLLKLVNTGIAMAGMAMIMYSLWMLRGWDKNLGPSISPDTPIPWFIYSFLGLGIIFCVITCSGHVAAETANGCCLYVYMMFIFLLLMLEAAVTTDILLNENWEQDFPEDPSGNFDGFKYFVQDNSEMCKWIALSVVAIQGLSLLLAVILKALGPHLDRYYESDDDYLPGRVPLLRPYVPPPNLAVGDPVYGSKNDVWNIKINSKVTK